MGFRIGIDVGGTFTDFVLVRPDGALVLSKVPTTLTDQSIGVMQGLAALVRKTEESEYESPRQGGLASS